MDIAMDFLFVDMAFLVDAEFVVMFGNYGMVELVGETRTELYCGRICLSS